MTMRWPSPGALHPLRQIAVITTCVVAGDYIGFACRHAGRWGPVEDGESGRRQRVLLPAEKITSRSRQRVPAESVTLRRHPDVMCLFHLRHELFQA